MTKGMEFYNEYVFVEELNNRLEMLSQDNWSVQAIVPGHANIYEMGTRAVVLVLLKRPKRGNN